MSSNFWGLNPPDGKKNVKHIGYNWELKGGSSLNIGECASQLLLAIVLLKVGLSFPDYLELNKNPLASFGFHREWHIKIL